MKHQKRNSKRTAIKPRKDSMRPGNALTKIITVSGNLAMEEIERLLADRPSTGLHPVLFGSKNHADFMAENCLHVKDPKRILADSYKIDIPKLIAEWYSSEDEDELEEQKKAEEDWVAQDVGAAQDKEEIRMDQSLDLECAKKINDRYEGRWIDVVHIGLLDVEEPWQIFAHVGWEVDGWGNATKCALHRHWQNQWGAEVIALQETITECFVKRPPSVRRDAMNLAREQYYYCGDIVHQGVGTIQEHASELLNRKQWFFWWD
jgi:hypothetical protein